MENYLEQLFFMETHTVSTTVPRLFAHACSKLTSSSPKTPFSRTGNVLGALERTTKNRSFRETRRFGGPVRYFHQVKPVLNGSSTPWLSFAQLMTEYIIQLSMYIEDTEMLSRGFLLPAPQYGCLNIEHG
jgi:hypothetical protein